MSQARQNWTGWRRPQGSSDSAAWQMMVSAPGATRAEAFQLLMEVCELTTGDNRRWAYLLLPAGERPQQETSRPTYRDRALYPQARF